MSNKYARDAAVKQMREFTQATQADATRLLKTNSWRLEAAMDAFYSDAVAMSNANKANAGSINAKAEKALREKLGKQFDEYKEPDGDIGIDGMLKLCDLLEIDPSEVTLAILSYYTRSPSMGVFKREDYINGWIALGDMDTVEKQKKMMVKIKEDLVNDAPVRGKRAEGEKVAGSGGTFNRVYDFVYNWGRPEGQKQLAQDTANAFWDMLIPLSPTFKGNKNGRFTQRQLDLWKKFLSIKVPGRSITKDVWTLFLEFTSVIDPEFIDHDEDGAWPSLIDDFVDWIREGNGASSNEMDVDQ